jgi:hypothetical protein
MVRPALQADNLFTEKMPACKEESMTTAPGGLARGNLHELA